MYTHVPAKVGLSITYNRSRAEIKRHAAEVIAELRVRRRPVFITQRGRSAAVLLEVKTYEGLLRRLAVLEGIARGERAFAEGRVVTHPEARKRLSVGNELAVDDG